MEARAPTVFRPLVAKYLYETYCPAGGRVWDPCSGYGARMLAATSLGLHYTGTDVESETIAGNQALADDLGVSALVSLYQTPAEDFTPPPVDMVFTSPPYFNRELYSQSKSQSWVKHGSSFEVWSEKFLRKVIVSAFSSLPSGGVLALNIADIQNKKSQTVPLVQTTKDLGLEEGFELEATIWMPLPKLNRRKGKGEPVLIFRKP